MAYPDLKIIIEYDGRHHASRWLADSKRREALEDEGWLYIQVTAEISGMRILKGNGGTCGAEDVIAFGGACAAMWANDDCSDSRWSEEGQPSVRLQAHISLMNGGIGLRHDAISLIDGG